MMKFILSVLILGNVGLFAYHHGYLADVIPSDHEPNRLAQQVNPDKIALLAASVATAPNPEVAAAAKKAETIACLEIGSFTIADAKRFEALLTPLALGERQSRFNQQEVASHIVYIPPQGSKEAADKKAGELHQLGVNNFFVIQDISSPLHWGISLGVFKTDAAAQNQLAALSKQGVHSARVGTRSVSTNKLAFQLREINQETKARLDAIKAEFPNQELRTCNKPGEVNAATNANAATANTTARGAAPR